MLKSATLVVKGTYYYTNNNLDPKYLSTGQLIRLEPSPDNKYDKYAVKVVLLESGIMIGYIPKEFSKKYYKLVQDGCVNTTYVCKVDKNEYGNYVFSITVKYNDNITTNDYTKINGYSSIVNRGGVYSITCDANKTIYIGSSHEIKSRIAEHFRQLISNVHVNNLLQDDFSKYGLKQFSVKVVGYIEETSQLIHKEAIEIDNLNSSGARLYNKTIDGVGIARATNKGMSISNKKTNSANSDAYTDKMIDWSIQWESYVYPYKKLRDEAFRVVVRYKNKSVLWKIFNGLNEFERFKKSEEYKELIELFPKIFLSHRNAKISLLNYKKKHKEYPHEWAHDSTCFAMPEGGNTEHIYEIIWLPVNEFSNINSGFFAELHLLAKKVFPVTEKQLDYILSENLEIITKCMSLVEGSPPPELL